MVRTILALAFALALCGSAAAQNTVGGQPILCNKVDVNSNLAAGTTQLIAGVAGQPINICGWTWDENANGTVQMVFGTGASCTSSTAITSVVTIAVNGIQVNHVPYAFVSSAPGQSLCAIVTGTGTPVNIDVYFAQQP